MKQQVVAIQRGLEPKSGSWAQKSCAINWCA